MQINQYLYLEKSYGIVITVFIYRYFMNLSKNAFVERLRGVLGDRKRHVWGVALGFTNNRVHRLFRETESLPSTEELALIGEAENLSLNWLVYGTGPKYRVQSFLNSNEFNTAIEQVLTDRWTSIFIVTCQSRCALLTTRPKLVLYKNRQVNLRQMTCLTGPGSAKLQSIVKAASSRGVEFPIYLFEELEAGELGAYFLFGDGRTRGYLEDLEEQDVQWLLGNMPLAASLNKIDLMCLIGCYHKIESFMKSTGQRLNNEKISELTWVMYQTEMVEQLQLVSTQSASSSAANSANGEV